MQKSAGRMQNLITDLLQYARVNGENVYEKWVAVDLKTIVDEVMGELADEIEKRGARIHVSSLPLTQGIPFQLHQLFVNLFDNSLKFTKPGQPPVILIGSSRERDGEKLYDKITFSDEGIGFNNEHHERIFDVFQRLHGKEIHGTGIGLAICRKIMENHNGKIRATGREGEGTVFELLFPVQGEA